MPRDIKLIWKPSESGNNRFDMTALQSNMKTLEDRLSNNNPPFKSKIRDNWHRGTVAEFLKSAIKNNPSLSVVSAYFTIYAYDALKASLNQIDELRFLFGDPDFIKNLDPNNADEKSFEILDAGLELKDRLKQKPIAKACADWIDKKVQIRTTCQLNLLHGKLYHIAGGGGPNAIMGSSNFTVRGLGLDQTSSNIELNVKLNDEKDCDDLKAWFDHIWTDTTLVKDVKAEVLAALNRLGKDHAPEFIYF